MIPWLHLMTPLIGAKITVYAISCTVHEVTLFSLKGNYWNRNSNEKINCFGRLLVLRKQERGDG